MSEVELLTNNGVKFPEGSSARYFAGSSTLLVRNTPTNLDLISSIVDQINEVTEYALKSDPFASSDGPTALAPEPPVLPALDDAPFGGGHAARPSWSSERDRTRLWRESNYYRFHGATDESFIRLNRFWLDLTARAYSFRRTSMPAPAT